MGKIERVFKLDGEGIEACSGLLEKELQSMKVKKKYQIRIRLSIEEALLRFRDRFGESGSFRFVIQNTLRQAFVQLEMEGEICNPLNRSDGNQWGWDEVLLTTEGLSPVFNYSGGKNILRMRIPRRRMNATLRAIAFVAGGLLIGALLNLLLPGDALQFIYNEILEPLEQFWIRTLSVLSGPVVFLTICTAVLNSWKIEEVGGNNKKVLIRYFVLSIAAGLLAMLAAFVILQDRLIFYRQSGTELAESLDLFLYIMPENIVQPFETSNSSQICLIAMAVGTVVSALGSRAESVSTFLRQANVAGLRLTKAVSRGVPYFAAMMVWMLIMSRETGVFRGMLEILLVSIGTAFVYFLFVSVHVSAHKHVPYRTLLQKLLPSFLAVLKSGNVDEGFRADGSGSISKLGVDHKFAQDSMSYGLVLYMAANVIGTIIIILFIAGKTEAVTSFGWLLNTLILAVILFIATPPVPGANLLAYIMLFSVLAIPSSYMREAMLFEIIFGLFAAAFNQAVLQLDLVIQADGLGLLNRERLKAEE